MGIKGGKVYSLTAPGLPLEAAKTIEAKGDFVLPGCVDAHIHSRDPGLTHKEDFATLTQAAAAGGVTTIMCQPNTVPAISTVQTFMQVLEDWSKKAVVDFAIQAMAEPGNRDESARCWMPARYRWNSSVQSRQDPCCRKSYASSMRMEDWRGSVVAMVVIFSWSSRDARRLGKRTCRHGSVPSRALMRPLEWPGFCFSPRERHSVFTSI